jgi:hypothetical protein
LSPNYLSEQWAKEDPKKGPSLSGRGREKSPDQHPRGALLGARGSECPSLPPGLPPSTLLSFLLLLLFDATQPGLSPSPTWEFAVWTPSEHSKLSSGELWPSGVERPPQRAPQDRASLCLMLPRSGPAGLCDPPCGDHSGSLGRRQMGIFGERSSSSGPAAPTRRCNQQALKGQLILQESGLASKRGGGVGRMSKLPTSFEKEKGREILFPSSSLASQL